MQVYSVGSRSSLGPALGPNARAARGRATASTVYAVDGSGSTLRCATQAPAQPRGNCAIGDVRAQNRPGVGVGWGGKNPSVRNFRPAFSFSRRLFKTSCAPLCQFDPVGGLALGGIEGG